MLAAMEELFDSWPGTLIVVSHDRYLAKISPRVAPGLGMQRETSGAHRAAFATIPPAIADGVRAARARWGCRLPRTFRGPAGRQGPGVHRGITATGLSAADAGVRLMASGWDDGPGCPTGRFAPVGQPSRMSRPAGVSGH